MDKAEQQKLREAFEDRMVWDDERGKPVITHPDEDPPPTDQEGD